MPVLRHLAMLCCSCLNAWLAACLAAALHYVCALSASHVWRVVITDCKTISPGLKWQWLGSLVQLMTGCVWQYCWLLSVESCGEGVGLPLPWVMLWQEGQAAFRPCHNRHAPSTNYHRIESLYDIFWFDVCGRKCSLSSCQWIRWEL